MIIKVEGRNGQWFLAQAETLTYEITTKEEMKKIAETPGVRDKIPMVIFSAWDEERPDKFETLIEYKNEKGQDCAICCNTRAFILNDEGKTIDRI